jgi:D-glycero-D-manno-heptose 1,7-bisphosphate phosphatase
VSARSPQPAVFLDRDGVLVEDVNLLVRPEEMHLYPEVAATLRRAVEDGFELVVVTNQTVVARGLATLAEVDDLHRHLSHEIAAAGGPTLEHFYVCPHHPHANLAEYRVVCDCRKPRPGLLARAAAELHIDLERSFFVGDRMSDVVAGARAGCFTILLETGAHTQPPIESVDPIDPSIRPDRVCRSLPEALAWIEEARLA